MKERFARGATLVAVMTSPLVAAWMHGVGGYSWAVSFAFAMFAVGAFRAALELILRSFIEPPTLSLDAEPHEMETDALARRRMYFWKGKFRLGAWFVGTVTLFWLLRGGGWVENASWLLHSIVGAIGTYWQLAVIMPIYFLFNFLILMGPMAFNGIRQMVHLEPGDADFGVKLADVRGQAEAKEEIRKVVTLWQAGDKFMQYGGERERGILFLGSPGTGKTMLAKGIATAFNSPISIMPGSAFAQTFIGMDVMVVQWMMWKARRLARKWGGQAIIFIDEIDAVGMRRAALGGNMQYQMPGGMFGGMGQQGLQSILVAMDGIDKPPFMRKLVTNKLNLWLDASFIVPLRIGRVPLRLPRVKPDGTQVFFIGATNVPLEALDPALTRAGRLGRHIYFRDPTKRDRLDIFDLYLDKVSHEPSLDTPEAREELARVTSGYSPSKIKQVCSIALAYAHHNGRDVFSRDDILEAMVTVEAGTALGWGYESEEEEWATAVHEAGHAVCAHLFKKESESTRLSIRRRGATGGHHQAVEIQERAFKNRDELFADLIWGLGAYAAEMAFFGITTQGVGGDLQQASWLAGTMVGRWGMIPDVDEGDDKKKLAEIGGLLLVPAGQNDVRLGPRKERAEAILLGLAMTEAWNAVSWNKAGVEKIAKRLVRDKEIYGDDLQKLLQSCGLVLAESWDYPEIGV